MEKQHDVRQLAGLDEWQLEHDDQDLRGQMLITSDGQNVGEVDDMLADLDEERIVALRLTDGRIVNIDAVDLRDGRPVLLVDTAHVAPAPAGVERGQVTSEHIPIIEERMDIGKREVELGTVRIRTRVISENVGEDVSLREEHVNVERRPMNEHVTAEQADAMFKEGTIEVTETGERVVVSKDAVVTGEVVVDKDVDTRVERVEETVRRTEVDVDRDTPSKR